MSKTFNDWLTEGEELYSAALRDYQAIEAQLDELEAKLVTKKSEVNQIAQIIGKPPIESSRRVTAQLVEDHGHSAPPNSPAVIARALTGRVLNRSNS